MESNIGFQNTSIRVNTFRSPPDRPVIRTTYQLSANIGPKQDQNAQEVWIKSIKSIIGWLRSRCATELPQEAWEGKDFECGVPGHQVECITVPSQGLWSLRLTHPDAPHGEREAVPGRSWTTELALKQGDIDMHQLGVRVALLVKDLDSDEVVLYFAVLLLCRYYSDASKGYTIFG